MACGVRSRHGERFAATIPQGLHAGEVHGGKIKLEETVVPCGVAAGFEPVLVLINDREFTKTANCWGVNNNDKGTNTNRVVVMRKAQ